MMVCLRINEKSAPDYRTKTAPKRAHLPMCPDPRVEGGIDSTKGPGKEIGYQGHDKKELPQLSGIPCPLQVLSAIEDRGGSDKQSHNVSLDQRSGEKDPGVEINARFDCEIRHTVSVLVISDGVVEDG